VRIACVVPGGVDSSGTERVIPCLLWLLEEWAREHDVQVFALHHDPRPGQWTVNGVPVSNAGARPRYARTVAAIAATHGRAPFDFLYAVWAEAGVPAGVAARLLRRPLILHLTGGDLVALPEIGYGLLLTRRGRIRLRIAAECAARVLVPSLPGRADASRRGIDAERVPLGVSLRAWPPVAPLRRHAGEPLRLVHVASLNAVKDQSNLLDAIARLRETGAAFHLDVAGVDTTGGAVQRHAAALGLLDHVTFHGFLPQLSLRPLLIGSHVLVVSSRHETGPIAALEAAVAGVPTVGTAVGHVAEWAPQAAVAVTPADPDALARAIFAIHEDEDRRLAIAAAAQQRAIAEDATWTARRVLAIAAEVQQPV
jgi:glycosyltransferase involved in cell wall biosynthesis